MMKTVAVICEYNPFHRGHEYQLMEIRRRFGDCRVVGVMSGAMTERGEPAILDKYSRAEAAVSCGCDLVVELPAPWSMAGAEFFARAGVSLASAVGADTLAFGSECGDIDVLRKTAEFLSSEDYKSAIAAARDENPHLQAGALRNLVLEKNLGSVPTGSNDILAIEYLRATASLGVRMEAVTIKREGGDYNSPDKCAFASATAVRDMLRRGEDPSGFLPAASAEILKRDRDAGRLCIKPLDEAVSAFLRLSCREMRGKMEVSGGIENRLHEAAKKRRDIEGILDLASERRYSRSRLRRAIFGSMLGYTMADLAETPLYTSLLAANEVGRGMVSGITIPAISRPSDYKRLPGEAREQFERAVRADYLQELCSVNGLEIWKKRFIAV